MTKRPAVTLVPKVYLQVPEFNVCPSRLETLGFTNIPQLFSVLEQSFPEGRPDTSLTAQHWYFKPKEKENMPKPPQTFPCSCKKGHRWVTLPKNYLDPTLWKRSECSSETASDFTAPRAEEPNCTIIQTLQPHVLQLAGLETMKSVDFCFPEGTTILSWGLEKPEVSNNQNGVFNSITHYFKLF